MLHVLGAVLGLFGAMYFLPPFQRGISRLANWLGPNRIPDPTTLIEARFRKIITEDEYKEYMRQHGFDDRMSELIYNTYYRLTTIEQSLALYFRGIIDEEELQKRLEAQGVHPANVKDYIRLYYVLPSPSDLIRFMVRDVFRPEVVEKYGLDEELPLDLEIPRENLPEWIKEYWKEEKFTFADLVKMQGIDPEVMRWYWRAHWILPSPTMAYEMLRRLRPAVLDKVIDEEGTPYWKKYEKEGLKYEDLVVTEEDVDRLLKIADYPKFWRTRMRALAYEPLTRVDLRRLYVLGLVNDEECLARLMELGYTEEDAKKLLEFYKALKQSSERDLTKSEILKLYHIGEIKREEAKDMLKDLGYSDEEADFLLDLEEYKMWKEWVDDEIDVLVEMYVQGAIDFARLRDELDKLGISATQRDLILMKAVRRKKRMVKLPPLSDLKRMYQNGIISEEEFKDAMRAQGYPEEWIERYIKLFRIAG